VTAGPLSDSERVAWLRLARTPNVGPVAFEHLLQRCGSAAAAVDALPDLARRSCRHPLPKALKPSGSLRPATGWAPG
jgi:DNA processing protein